MRKRIISICANVALILLTVALSTEGFLRYVDYWGIHRNVADSRAIGRVEIPAQTGYVMQTGKHQFSNWRAIITDQYTRYVYPQNLNADCTIAFIGDSNTFGMGVNDEYTFASLFAQGNHDVSWINAGVVRYSTRNVYLRQQQIDADGYIWLVISNDSDAPEVYLGALFGRSYLETLTGIQLHFAAMDYWQGYWARRNFKGRSTDASIHQHIALSSEMAMRDDTLIFAYDDVALAHRPPRALVIERPTGELQVSWFDGHPNEEGHREIYDAMLPTVNQFVERVCHLRAG